MFLKDHQAQDPEWPSEFADVRIAAAKAKLRRPHRPDPGTPGDEHPGHGSPSTARARHERHRGASEGRTRILAAAVRVMQRLAPETARVDDIVAEAGSSKAFYRYFRRQDDLLLAVMERGIGIVTSIWNIRWRKLQGHKARSRPGRGRAGAGVRSHLISMSRAVVQQMTDRSDRGHHGPPSATSWSRP